VLTKAIFDLTDMQEMARKVSPVDDLRALKPATIDETVV
jgi:hypothetical protein